ncbi:MAG: hypothetical protein M1826_002003 [Phylliscum demangeonii]|nr:MAG: hypothetical protein M1826_002003 [Phylliscum demangeonii]
MQVGMFLSLTARQTNCNAIRPAMMMYTPKKMVSLLLASLLAAQHVNGSLPPKEPIKLFGYPIEEVPHALRTPIVILLDELKTLTAFGRQSNIFAPLEPNPQMQDAFGHDPNLRLRYFAFEAAKRWQRTLIYRGMMEDNDFLACMAPCLRLTVATLLEKVRIPISSAFFPAARCQETTGQHRGIAFPYVSDYLYPFQERPLWHDLSQEHPPYSALAKQAQPLLETHAMLRPHISRHRLALPDSKSFARLAHSWQRWEGAVQKKMPAMQRTVVAGEERVGGL